jgi:hypothetical protein
MINQNNKSLNDLFRSAQSEAEKDVLSQSEVERLLQSVRRSVPVTQSIGQQLAQRLLSTPLKIGMTAMTTAACITLGLIAFWPQTSSQPVTKTPISPNVAYSSPGTDATTQHFATLPTSKPSFVVSPATVATLANAIIPTTPIATADSLQPVELSPDQLAKLGIVLEDNGDIDFYTKSGSSGEVNKFGLPPSWGIRLNLDENIPQNEIAGLLIPKSPPRLVTEPNGAKRLFSFESDTTISNSDGIQKMIMQFRNEMNILPAGYDSIQQNPNDERVFIHVIGDSNVSNTSNFKLDIDSNSRFINPSKNFNASMQFYIKDDFNNIERLTNAIRKLGLADSQLHKLELRIDELHDSAANSDVNAELRVAGASLQQAQKLAIDFGKALAPKKSNNVAYLQNGPSVNGTTVNAPSVNGYPTVMQVYGNSPSQIEVNANSSIPQGQSVITINGISNTNPNGSINVGVSPRQSASVILNDDKKVVDDSMLAEITQQLNIKTPGDSSCKHAVKLLLNINSFNKEKIDSEASAGRKLIEEIRESLESGGSDSLADSARAEQIMQISRNWFGSNVDSLGNGRSVNFEINTKKQGLFKNPFSLDHLIPIRVVNLKNAEHPNELIFWYEPTPELTSSLPSAVNSNPAPQSKQLAISVYPNPTLGPATIHYELADAPKAYFSVRNLLGQEVLNGGVTSSTTGDAQLDLSQLPAGVYLLVTTTDNGERDVERVVVTK